MPCGRGVLVAEHARLKQEVVNLKRAHVGSLSAFRKAERKYAAARLGESRSLDVALAIEKETARMQDDFLQLQKELEHANSKWQRRPAVQAASEEVKEAALCSKLLKIASDYRTEEAEQQWCHAEHSHALQDLSLQSEVAERTQEEVERNLHEEQCQLAHLISHQETAVQSAATLLSVIEEPVSKFAFRSAFLAQETEKQRVQNRQVMDEIRSMAAEVQRRHHRYRDIHEGRAKLQGGHRELIESEMAASQRIETLRSELQEDEAAEAEVQTELRELLVELDSAERDFNVSVSPDKANKALAFHSHDFHVVGSPEKVKKALVFCSPGKGVSRRSSTLHLPRQCAQPALQENSSPSLSPRQAITVQVKQADCHATCYAKPQVESLDHANEPCFASPVPAKEPCLVIPRLVKKPCDQTVITASQAKTEIDECLRIELELLQNSIALAAGTLTAGTPPRGLTMTEMPPLFSNDVSAAYDQSLVSTSQPQIDPEENECLRIELELLQKSIALQLGTRASLEGVANFD